MGSVIKLRRSQTGVLIVVGIRPEHGESQFGMSPNANKATKESNVKSLAKSRSSVLGRSG